MKNCPNCNASVPDIANFCPKCRFNIKQYEEEKQNEVLYCMNCGAELLSDADFCIACGADVIKDENVPSQAETTDTFNFGIVDSLSTVATKQLYDSEGLTVENGVLVGYTGKKRTVTIFGSIEEIFDRAFKDNNFVTSVIIEEGVQTIGKEAFANCSDLKEITIPLSCKRIYENTFARTHVETLILFEMNEETLALFTSETAKKYLSNEEISNFINTRDDKLIIDVKGMEKLSMDRYQKEEDERKRIEAEHKAEQSSPPRLHIQCLQPTERTSSRMPALWPLFSSFLYP